MSSPRAPQRFLAARRATLLAAAALVALLPACGGGSDGGGGGCGGDVVAGTTEQAYNLQQLNAYRALVNAPPLLLYGQLSSFATAGSQELMADHQPHQHFADAGNALFTTYAFSGSTGENQGDPNGWPSRPTVEDQIDEILAAMWAEGPGTGAAHGYYNSMVNPAYTRLGVGLVLDANGLLYFTNDFSE